VDHTPRAFKCLNNDFSLCLSSFTRPCPGPSCVSPPHLCRTSCGICCSRRAPVGEYKHELAEDARELPRRHLPHIEIILHMCMGMCKNVCMHVCMYEARMYVCLYVSYVYYIGEDARSVTWQPQPAARAGRRRGGTGRRICSTVESSAGWSSCSGCTGRNCQSARMLQTELLPCWQSSLRCLCCLPRLYYIASNKILFG